MAGKTVVLKLSLILSEAYFVILFYYGLTNSLLKTNALINPVLLFVPACVFTLFNIYFSKRKTLYIYVLLLNMAVFALILWTTYLFTGVFIFSFQGGDFRQILNSLLLQASVLYIIARSVFIALKNNEIKIYRIFDITISLTFASILLNSVPGSTVSFPLTWVLTPLFLNFYSLFLYNRNKAGSSFIAVLLILAAVASTVFFSSGNLNLYPGISGAAGSVFEVIKSAFAYMFTIFLFLLAGFIKFFQGKNFNNEATNRDNYNTGTASNPLEEYSLNGVGDFSWMNNFLKIFLGIVIILVITAAAILLFRLARWLVSRLMMHSGNNQKGCARKPFSLWKSLYEKLKLFLKKLNVKSRTGLILSIIFPRRLNVRYVYSQLLRWGAMKKTPRKPSETPNDYGKRLAGKFPDMGEEIERITTYFVYYMYSGNSGTPGQADRSYLRYALIKLYSYSATYFFKTVYRYVRKLGFKVISKTN